MRKLRNTEATELMGQLTELVNTPEKPLASVLLTTLSEHYYRPLRRRIPCAVAIDLNDQGLWGLDHQSQQLASLIPEVRTVLIKRDGV